MPEAASKLAMQQKRDSLAPPAWASAMCGERFALVSATVPGICDCSADEFERKVFEAYVWIAQQLNATDVRFPVRFWNHVPLITDPADAGRDNYMVFNAGRFRAFSDLLGGPGHFERDVATASATGHWGRDLVIHCLSADAPGRPVNNPRQVAPYHYSQRFGPLPPCFARATRLDDPSAVLLVGGTASVRGEDSVHVDDLVGQLGETFLNLASLVGAATGEVPRSPAQVAKLLSAYRDLRVYHPNRSDADEIESSVRAAFGGLRNLQLIHADLCRAELLVEIEGLGELSA